MLNVFSKIYMKTHTTQQAYVGMLLDLFSNKYPLWWTHLYSLVSIRNKYYSR